MDTSIDFERFWREVEPELLSVARRYLGPSAEVLDVVQEVAAVWLYRMKHSPASVPSTEEGCRRWLWSTTRYRALDELRNRRRRHHESLANQPAGKEQDPGGKFESEEELRRLREAIEKLPPRQRQVMQSYLDGQPITSIAQKMEIEESSVRSLLRFARRAVVSLGEQNGEEKNGRTDS